MAMATARSRWRWRAMLVLCSFALAGKAWAGPTGLDLAASAPGPTGAQASRSLPVASDTNVAGAVPVRALPYGTGFESRKGAMSELRFESHGARALFGAGRDARPPHAGRGRRP
jgi:hypothetical protein